MKLYVLLRRDLGQPYKFVQAGHAVAEILIKQKIDWENGFLIYLDVENEDAIHHWEHKLTTKGIQFETFKEPDLQNQTTALAALADAKVFRDLRLAQ